jgi:hypothetical protein
MSATIQAQKHEAPGRIANQRNLLDRENAFASAHGRETLSLCGGVLSTQAGKKESIARSLETNRNTSAQTLSDRLTPSLISAGLVCGIIPMSMRDVSNQLTLDSVLKPQAGGSVGKQKAD